MSGKGKLIVKETLISKEKAFLCILQQKIIAYVKNKIVNKLERNI